MKTYSHKEILDLLKRKQGDRNCAQFAREVGITKSYMGDILKGKRTPGPKVLRYLGLQCAIIPKSKTA